MCKSSKDKHHSKLIKAIPQKDVTFRIHCLLLEIQTIDMILGEKNKGMFHLMRTSGYSPYLNLSPNSLHRHHPID